MSSWTLLVDKAGTTSGAEFSVNVLASFAANSFATTNVSGGNEGKPEKGDTVFAYTSAPLPSSIISGWSGGSPVSVTATITQSSSNDTLTVSGAALGTVELKGNYVSKTVTFNSSSLALSGNSIVLTLGTPSASSSLKDDNANRAPIWKPSSSAKDLAEKCLLDREQRSPVLSFRPGSRGRQGGRRGCPPACRSPWAGSVRSRARGAPPAPRWHCGRGAALPAA